jgi:hypothetical protein
MLHVLQWAIHVCFKCIFQMFYLFQTYVASVLFGCCKTRSGCCIYMQVFPGVFIRMLQVFHLDICMFLQWLHMCFQVFFWYFASVLNVYCKCINYFGSMLQAFYLDVAKIDQILHILQCAWEAECGTSSPCVRSGNVSVVQAARVPHGRTKCKLRTGACWPEREKRECSADV